MYVITLNKSSMTTSTGTFQKQIKKMPSLMRCHDYILHRKTVATIYVTRSPPQITQDVRILYQECSEIIPIRS